MLLIAGEIKHDLEKKQSVPEKCVAQDRMLLVTGTLVRGSTVHNIYNVHNSDKTRLLSIDDRTDEDIPR